MAQLAVRLPNGRRVELRAYVAAWRRLLSMDAGEMVAGWDYYPCAAGDVLREMRRGLHDRINRRGGLVNSDSRVHPATWSQARTPRVRIEPGMGATLPPAARRALAHRIHAFED